MLGSFLIFVSFLGFRVDGVVSRGRFRGISFFGVSELGGENEEVFVLFKCFFLFWGGFLGSCWVVSLCGGV